MPLIKKPSKQAFEHNMSAEMDAGKPKDQSLAIAYSIKRKNKKKMANGGLLLDAKSESEANADNASTSESMGMRKESSGSPIKHPQFNTASKETVDMALTPEEMEMVHKSRGEKSKSVDITANQEGHATADNQRRKAMADGGMATADNAETDEDEDMLDQESSGGSGSPDMDRMRKMAKGGYLNTANSDGEPDADNAETDEDEKMMMARGGSVADKIMRKRKMMADGGQVDLEGNSEEDLNNEDQMSYKAGLKEQYDLSQLGDEPEDSNEHGDEREDAAENINDDDMIESIRKRMKARRG